MSRRSQIQMTAAEVALFLAQERTVVCATIGRDGYPHLMPLWYCLRGAAQVWAWTFAKSQKTRNIERDPRATLQVEAGEEYNELRGAMLKTTVTIHRETEVVRDVGREVFARHHGVGVDELTPGVLEAIAAQAPKRVALQFVECERATWDHRKLAGGVY